MTADPLADMGKATAIIVAAGCSSRMGFDKIFAEILGKPVLLYSLEAFQAAKMIDEIIVVNENNDKINSFAHHIPKLSGIVKGGKNRAESVRNGLNAIRSQQGIVAIHDGARPLITPDLIDKIVNEATLHKAAIPAVPVRDTIKKVKDDCVESTPNRETLCAAQTPQCFDLALYRKAMSHQQAVTDDSMGVEQIGVKVKIVPGDCANIKITTPEDLKIARALLSGTD